MNKLPSETILVFVSANQEQHKALPFARRGKSIFPPIPGAMKNSHLLALFVLVFVVSTLMTNFAFHSMGWDRLDEPGINTLSIQSAKNGFRVGMNYETGKGHGLVGIKSVVNPATEQKQTGESSPGSSSVRPIELLLPQEDIEWIRRRNQSYFDFYLDKNVKRNRDRRWNQMSRDPKKHDINETTGFTNYDEDREKVWMDFLIAGHPKTGTTTLVANLAKVAPMKVKDFCASKPATILHYVIDAWPQKFPEIMDGPNKYVSDKSLMMVGSKCPQFIGDPELLSRFTISHPRMKLIVGIRHPVEWFNSFIRMGHTEDLYKKMKICPHYKNIDPISGIPGGIASNAARNKDQHEICIAECRCGIPICFHRSRLHIGLARIGKTGLSSDERKLLAPKDPDGGENLFDAQAKNPVFVYDQSQMKEDSYWDELAGFLGLNYIPNEHYHSSKGSEKNVTLCIPFYDEFRSKIMEHSYNMSVWLEDYFLPLGLDPNRPDVVIANTKTFQEIIQTYKRDPCGRLVRNELDGTYVLDSSFLVGTNRSTFEKHAHEAIPCRGKFPKRKEEDGTEGQKNLKKRGKRG